MITIKAGTRLYFNKDFQEFTTGSEITILKIERETLHMSNGIPMTWNVFLRLLKNGTLSLTRIAPY
jgi:hypothetical protein